MLCSYGFCSAPAGAEQASALWFEPHSIRRYLKKEMKTDIRSLSYDELNEFIKSLDQPKYRTDQIFSWMHQKCVQDFDEMKNIPKTLRDELSQKCTLRPLETEKVQISKEDGTRKYLFRLEDGNMIESVLMRYRHGNSVCVSSQVGCAMSCSFCASTLDGLIRNLSASEMLGQVYMIQQDTGERVSNVVIMGMGEPLTNYDNVVRFIRLLSDEKTLHISQRNITMSTCGIVPAIDRLADEDLKITLALSLHAPSDDIRRRIMPVAEKYSIDEILGACRRYFEKTGRRVTFEYCMIGGVNDSKPHAKQLADMLKGTGAHVNLIPVNPTPENNCKESSEKNISGFRKILENSGITVTRRREMGRDISGACGQLRHKTVLSERAAAQK